MNKMQTRVKDRFPSVLLTLLSIVQAVALELLWSHVQTVNYLFELSVTNLINWIQTVSTFLGLILVWVIYAGNAMRLRWVPTTTDSVYPFFIGILQFALINTLGIENLGAWFVLFGLIFATMVWTSHVTMRRARNDPDNELFFKGRERAKLKDFYSHIAGVSFLVLSGLFILFSGNIGLPALAMTFAALLLLIWQYAVNAIFWRETVTTPRP